MDDITCNDIDSVKPLYSVISLPRDAMLSAVYEPFRVMVNLPPQNSN